MFSDFAQKEVASHEERWLRAVVAAALAAPF